MRLYLSSFRMGDRFEELVAAVGGVGRVAVVSNAVDNIPAAAREAYARNIHDPLQVFRDYGLEAFDLDLRQTFGRPAETAAALSGVRLIWAVGGNTFLLRRAMFDSGLDQLIRRGVEAGEVIYGGWSAGAVVAAKDISGIEQMDAPDEVAAVYGKPVIREGLGLVDELIVPHFQSDHPEADAALQTHLDLTARGVPHRTLRDGEVIIV